MSDADALLAAIRAAPDDDAPRLVYADWLDEHGQPERAELIRVQCELARTDSSALRQREVELLAGYHDTFAGPRALPGLRFRFHRGFIMGFGHTGCFYEAPNIDPGPRTLLCFRPDGGVAFDADPWRGIEYSLPRMLLANFPSDSLSIGRYSVDPIYVPMGIEFTCTSVAGAIVFFRGFLEGQAMHLDVHDHVTARYTRRHFSHHTVPGFDSFTET